jgi:hypothetical protein
VGEPSTTVHPPGPLVLTGKPNCRPSGTPYSPFDTTASEVTVVPGVARRMLTTESMAALAAEAAEDSRGPR